MTASLTDLRRRLTSETEASLAKVARADSLDNEIAYGEAEVARLQALSATLDQAAALLNSLADERQEEAQLAVESLVTEGLQSIFDESLSFHIVTSQRGKSYVVEFVVRSDLPTGPVETPVLDARGGGLAAVVGFLIRVVFVMLTEDNPPPLVLDETFAHVSEEYLEALGEFLRKVVDQAGIQIILVTHQPTLAEYADKVYRFSLVSGKTKVQEVK